MKVWSIPFHIFMNSFFIFHLIHFSFRFIAEDVYCEYSLNGTLDTSEYDLCMVQVKERESDEKSKKTWFSIVTILGGFFVIFICKL